MFNCKAFFVKVNPIAFRYNYLKVLAFRTIFID